MLTNNKGQSYYVTEKTNIKIKVFNTKQTFYHKINKNIALSMFNFLALK